MGSNPTRSVVPPLGLRLSPSWHAPGSHLTETSTVGRGQVSHYHTCRSVNRGRPVRRGLYALIGAALPILLTACGTGTEPTSDLPAGAVAVSPSQSYSDWFAKTEACSGVTGSLSTIQFFVVPGVTEFSTTAGNKIGMWIKQGNRSRIVIAGSFQDHEMVVRHEMLHALIGVTGHPAGLFEGECRLTWETWSSAA